MKRRKKIAIVCLIAIVCTPFFPVYGKKTVCAKDSRKIQKEKAEEYLEENGVWVTSERMSLAVILPNERWETVEQDSQGYEDVFVSGENRIEFQILTGETAKAQREEIPQTKEELQNKMPQGIEVVEFESEITEEKIKVKTILEFCDAQTEQYRYSVSSQTYQGEKCLEAFAYTDKEELIYILAASVSSAELLHN